MKKTRCKMTDKDIKKFIAKARKLIAQDARNPLERGARKRPSMNFLNSISEIIIDLLDNLFTVSDQVYLINTINKKSSVSDTTYFKFLNENLKEEYDLYRKNRIFVLKIHKIKEALLLYPASAKIQFSAVFGSNVKVSFDDYQAFMKKYYHEQQGEFFKAHKVRTLDVQERGLVRHGKYTRPGYVTVLKRETFAHIAPKLKSHGSASGNNTVAKPVVGQKTVAQPKTSPEIKKAKVEISKKKNDAVSSGNTRDKNGFRVYSSHSGRDVLRDKEGDFRIRLVAGADAHNPKPLFNIIENRKEFPEEIINAKFLLADYNNQSLALNEPFIHLRDIDLIHYADPDTYGLIDGLLYVCETNYGKRHGYDFYRYYKGDIYFIENVYFEKGNVTFMRNGTNWSYKNISGDLAEYSQVVLDLKSQTRRS